MLACPPNSNNVSEILSGGPSSKISPTDEWVSSKMLLSVKDDS